jgi:hypothetical protein
MPAPETCPNCGANVPRRARACPECGSDESTGWSDRASTQSLGLPDDDEFDYDEFTRREFGQPKRSAKKTFWWVVALVLLILTVLALLPR